MSTQPDWHDAPTCVGIWVCDEGEISKTEWTVFSCTSCLNRPQDLAEFFRDGSRYYGPIPPDPKAPDATP